MNNKIIITSGEEKSISEKANLYIDIFGEEPRNEGYTDKDGNLYPLSYKGDLTGLEKFYNNKALENDRKKWAEKEGYIESIAGVLENNELVGFILGWADGLEHLNEEKFQLNEGEYNILKQQIQQVTGNISTERLFYAADLGIKPEYRNLGIASKLYNDRHEKIIQNGEKVVIVRTTKNRPVPYNRYIDKGFKEVYHYNDQQNRVIMILPIL